MKLKVATWGVGGLPALAFASAILFAMYARSVVGHWPFYAHPDPKDLPPSLFAALCTRTFLGAVASLLIFPILAGILFVAARAGHRKWHDELVGPVGLFLVGVGLWVAETLIRGNGGLLSWLLD